MVDAGYGRFVAIASAAALRAMPQLAAYSAAKAAVVGYVRALAADLAGTGVLANAICPGSTRGAMLIASAALYELDDQEAFAGQHLVRRLLSPAEVAVGGRLALRPGGVGADRRGDPRRRRAHAVAPLPVPVGWRLRPSPGPASRARRRGAARRIAATSDHALRARRRASPRDGGPASRSGTTWQRACSLAACSTPAWPNPSHRPGAALRPRR